MANILVCDDDKDIVEAIDIYLTQEGYHVLKAYDGEEGLKIIKEEKEFVIIKILAAMEKAGSEEPEQVLGCFAK